MPDEMKPIAEVHKDLIAQADAQAKAAADAHAAQVAENEKFMQGAAKLNQPQEEQPQEDKAKPTAKPAAPQK